MQTSRFAETDDVTSNVPLIPGMAQPKLKPPFPAPVSVKHQHRLYMTQPVLLFKEKCIFDAFVHDDRRIPALRLDMRKKGYDFTKPISAVEWDSKVIIINGYMRVQAAKDARVGEILVRSIRCSSYSEVCVEAAVEKAAEPQCIPFNKLKALQLVFAHCHMIRPNSPYYCYKVFDEFAIKHLNITQEQFNQFRTILDFNDGFLLSFIRFHGFTIDMAYQAILEIKQGGGFNIVVEKYRRLAMQRAAGPVKPIAVPISTNPVASNMNITNETAASQCSSNTIKNSTTQENQKTPVLEVPLKIFRELLSNGFSEKSSIAQDNIQLSFGVLHKLHLQNVNSDEEVIELPVPLLRRLIGEYPNLSKINNMAAGHDALATMICRAHLECPESIFDLGF